MGLVESTRVASQKMKNVFLCASDAKKLYFSHLLISVYLDCCDVRALDAA